MRQLDKVAAHHFEHCRLHGETDEEAVTPQILRRSQPFPEVLPRSLLHVDFHFLRAPAQLRTELLKHRRILIWSSGSAAVLDQSRQACLLFRGQLRDFPFRDAPSLTVCKWMSDAHCIAADDAERAPAHSDFGPE